MTPSETAELLQLIQAFDQRTVGHADVGAWHAVLHSTDLEDAKQGAIVWHSVPRERRIMPGDVKGEAAKIANARQAHPDEPPPVDPDDVVTYLAAHRAGKRRDPSRDVHIAIPVIDGRPNLSGFPDWLREEFTTSRDKARVDDWGWVQCPNCGDHMPPPDQALRYPTHKCTGSAS